MPIDFSKHFYIGCIPCYAHMDHPKDQTPCIVRTCPECNKSMWVSEKKRLLEAKDPDAFRVVCLECLARYAHDNGMELELKSL